MTNAQLGSLFGKTEDEIFKITGIRNRCIRDEHQIGSDLGLIAAQKLLTEFPEFVKKIDLLKKNPDFNRFFS